MDGCINFNKAVGITSAKALYRVRSITGQRKSGHAGTLDPGASGVLVLCLGKATKLVERVMDQPKVYRATARLDVVSETLDSDSPVTPVPVADIPSAEMLLEKLRSFEGLTEQTPPMISAVKVGGVPAYKRARSGQSFELKSRPVRIHWIHLHDYRWPTLDFEMACGRGTYVRSLIRDLGVLLGTGGCLTSLVRRGVGPFLDKDSWTLDSLAAAGDPSEYLIDLPRALSLLRPEAITIPSRPKDKVATTDK